MFFKYFALVLSITLSMPYVHAGVSDVGNGGYTRVCRAKNGKIKSVELLDYFEGRKLRHQKLDLGSSKLTVKEKVNRVIDRIAAFDPRRASDYRRHYKHYMSKRKFLKDGQSNPAPTHDHNSPIVPKKGSGCKYEIAIRQEITEASLDVPYLVNPEIWNSPATSRNTKAGLILHEIGYREHILLNRGKRIDSRNARYFNSFVSSKEFGKMNPETDLRAYRIKLQESGLPIYGIDKEQFDGITLKFLKDDETNWTNELALPVTGLVNGFGPIAIEGYVDFDFHSTKTKGKSVEKVIKSVQLAEPVDTYLAETFALQFEKGTRLEILRNTENNYSFLVPGVKSMKGTLSRDTVLPLEDSSSYKKDKLVLDVTFKADTEIETNGMMESIKSGTLAKEVVIPYLDESITAKSGALVHDGRSDRFGKRFKISGLLKKSATVCGVELREGSPFIFNSDGPRLTAIVKRKVSINPYAKSYPQSDEIDLKAGTEVDLFKCRVEKATLGSIHEMDWWKKSLYLKKGSEINFDHSSNVITKGLPDSKVPFLLNTGKELEVRFAKGFRVLFEKKVGNRNRSERVIHSFSAVTDPAPFRIKTPYMSVKVRLMTGNDYSIESWGDTGRLKWARVRWNSRLAQICIELSKDTTSLTGKKKEKYIEDLPSIYSKKHRNGHGIGLSFSRDGSLTSCY